MAREVKVIIKDDLTDEEGAETIAFGVDNTWYEIDLTRDNEEAFRDLLKPYLDVARKADNPRSVRTRTGTTATTGMAGTNGYAPNHWTATRQRADKLARVRKWAKENGHRIADRGRIAEPIINAYNTANPRDQVELEPLRRPFTPLV